MSTPEQAVGPESGWREVDIKVDGLGRKVWAADGMLNALQKKIRGMLMGPSPDRGPDDYVRDDEERVTIPVRWLERALKPASNGHGNVNGSSKLLNALVTLNIAVTVAVSSWVVSNIIEQGKQIAVIECRLNPQCAAVVPRGNGP